MMAKTLIPATSVWHNLDRLAFCENAILLHLTNKSRGTSTALGRSARQQTQSQTSPDALYERFLDDIALVAAGDGGKDNIAAACLETDTAQPGRLFIRVARNDGVSEKIRRNLQSIIDMARRECPVTKQE